MLLYITVVTKKTKGPVDIFYPSTNQHLSFIFRAQKKLNKGSQKFPKTSTAQVEVHTPRVYVQIIVAGASSSGTRAFLAAGVGVV